MIGTVIVLVIVDILVGLGTKHEQAALTILAGKPDTLPAESAVSVGGAGAGALAASSGASRLGFVFVTVFVVVMVTVP